MFKFNRRKKLLFFLCKKFLRFLLKVLVKTQAWKNARFAERKYAMKKPAILACNSLR